MVVPLGSRVAASEPKAQTSTVPIPSGVGIVPQGDRMPSRSPRINVVVTEEQHALLLELGALQQRSASSFLREMLDAATPMFRAALPIWRAAAKQAEAQPEALRQAIQDVIGEADANRDQLDLLQLLAGHLPGSSSNDSPSASDAAASGASEDVSGREAASGRKRA
jgi:hypothetical protein